MSPLPDPAATAEISCEVVAGWHELPAAERPRLIDCREPEEWDICRLPGAELIPLGTFPQQAAALAAESPCGLVVYCHHGMRSLRAAMFLRSQGFQNAFSMHGGIDAWSRTVDPETPRY